MQRLVDQEGQLELDSLSDWKAPEQTVCDATEQSVTVVKMTCNKAVQGKLGPYGER